jgi:hypothetical protein
VISTGAVPAALPGPDGVVVERAWPDGDRGRILIEGPDRRGRLRAARLRLDPTGQVQHSELTPWAVDERLPDLAPAAAGAELLVHRWGRRAVVRHGTGFAKIVRPGRATELAERTELGADLAGRVGVTAPSARQVGEGRVGLSTVPGRTLHLGSQFGLSQWREIWSDWAAMWPRFCTGPTTGLTRRTASEEAGTSAQWVRRAVAHGVLDPAYAPLESALARLDAQLTTGDDATPVLCHRDLHDQQILVEPVNRRLGLLDLDTLCLADPALDLGNLAVHTHLRVEQGVWPQTHRAVALAAIAMVAHDLAVSPERLDAAVRATGLRLTGVYAFRPRWRELAHHWAREWAGPTHPLSHWVDSAPPLTLFSRPLR